MRKIPDEFKGIWIPRKIWLADDISILEKALLMQIDYFNTETSGCYASNAYFAELLQIDIRSVQRHLESLRSKGYVKTTYTNPTNKTGRLIHTNMSLQTKWGDESVIPAMTEVSGHAMTKVSHVVKSSSKNIEPSCRAKPNGKESLAILEFLNEKTGRNFQPVQSTLKKIQARLNEYSEQQLRQVIARKCTEWKGTKFEKYLQPSTLFGAEKCADYIGHLGTPLKTDRDYIR